MKVRKLRNRLRVLRAERQVTQVDLALMVRMPLSRYWRYEKGYEIPTEREQARLARALEVDIPALGFPVDEEAIAS
jgi:transcriptional regulator with XRE-family HTH domain